MHIHDTQTLMTEYLSLLRTGGSLVQVGIPEDGALLSPIRNLMRRLKVQLLSRESR